MIDVVVTGRSLPALQSALDFAEVGLSVVVLPNQAPVVSARHGHHDHDGHVRAFMRRIAQPIEGGELPGQADAEPQELPLSSPMLRDSKGAWAAQYEPNLYGIPAVPLATQSLALLGGSAMRAYLDRVMPLLTIGKTRFFADLVRKRVGKNVLSKLVEPQVFERFGASAEALEVAVAAPGLNETLSRVGALTLAVLAYADRNVARETRVIAAGGEAGLQAATLKKLEWYGVQPYGDRLVSAELSGEHWLLRLESSAELRARAVVSDHGSDPTVEPPAQVTDEALRPRKIRSYARIEIEAVAALAAGVSALDRNGDWTVRAEASLPEGGSSFEQPRMSALLSGRAQELGADTSRIRLESGLSQALSAANFSTSSAAEWRIETAAAPYLTLEERDAAVTVIDELLERHPSLLPVGQVLYGDDLGLALEQSHERAVALRRRLLGLLPEEAS